jgi:hypothetical protein
MSAGREGRPVRGVVRLRTALVRWAVACCGARGSPEVPDDPSVRAWGGCTACPRRDGLRVRVASSP